MLPKTEKECKALEGNGVMGCLSKLLSLKTAHALRTPYSRAQSPSGYHCDHSQYQVSA